MAGVPQRTFYNWLRADSNFAEKVEQARNRPVALAELMLQKLIHDGKYEAVKLFLQSRCPEYRQQATITTATPDSNFEVKFKIVAPEHETDFESLIEKVLAENERQSESGD